MGRHRANHTKEQKRVYEKALVNEKFESAYISIHIEAWNAIRAYEHLTEEDALSALYTRFLGESAKEKVKKYVRNFKKIEIERVQAEKEEIEGDASLTPALKAAKKSDILTERTVASFEDIVDFLKITFAASDRVITLEKIHRVAKKHRKDPSLSGNDDLPFAEKILALFREMSQDPPVSELILALQKGMRPNRWKRFLEYNTDAKGHIISDVDKILAAILKVDNVSRGAQRGLQRKRKNRRGKLQRQRVPENRWTAQILARQVLMTKGQH